MEDALWFVGSAVGFVGLLAGTEGLAQRRSLRPELGRKLAHISCGLLAAALPLVLAFPAIVVLAALFIPFMIASRRMGFFPVVHSAERSTLGEVYFPLGVFLVAALVPYRVEYAFGVLLLAFADAFAGLMGERFGRRTVPLVSGTKTYMGSATFFLITVGLGLWAIETLGQFSGRGVLVVLVIAIVTTLEEAVVGGGADNVILPVSGAAMLRILI